VFSIDEIRTHIINTLQHESLCDVNNLSNLFTNVAVLPIKTPVLPINTAVVLPINTPFVLPINIPFVLPINTPVVLPINTPVVLPINTPVEQQGYLLGEQQGYLLVKIIGRNTEKADTFPLTTTGENIRLCNIL
jgi:hypothetical protein